MTVVVISAVMVVTSEEAILEEEISNVDFIIEISMYIRRLYELHRCPCPCPCTL